MTTLREAAEMALGTLQDVCARLLYRGVSKDAGHPDQIALEQARQTIQALKQATEQSKQKRDPIAWNGWIVREVLFDEGEPVGHRAPPQPVAQPEAEPVVWQFRMRPDWVLDKDFWEPWTNCTKEQAADYQRVPHLHDWKYEVRLLYTHPPQRKPLTDEEIIMLTADTWGNASIAPQLAPAFARAIERAHGIGGEE